MNSLLDTLPLWVALLPLGLYLLALGWVHLGRRPVMVTGVWDGIVLGAATSGLAVVGPLSIVRPVAGGTLWGWLIVLLLFGLIVALCVLVSRPRLVVYNITVEQLRPVVAEVVSALDPAARWAGEAAAMPSRGLQLHIDGNGSMRSVSLVATGERPSLEVWAEFSRRLRQGVRRLRVRSSPWGAIFAAVGGIVVAVAAWSAYVSITNKAPPRRAPQHGAADARSPRSVGT
jgi:hypothetical protein